MGRGTELGGFAVGITIVVSGMSNSILSIQEAELDTAIGSAATPVLFYFWASWCGPCKLVSPSVEWAASNYGDRLKVIKMEVDANPQTVKQYKVEGVPALRLVKDGEVLVNYEGAITKTKLAALLEPYL